MKHIRRSWEEEIWLELYSINKTLEYFTKINFELMKNNLEWFRNY